MPSSLPGYRNFARQAKIDQSFLAIPDAKLAGEELKTLTAEPHIAASPEDYKTAEYVAGKFKAAGLETSIVPYKAWLNMPISVSVEAFGSNGAELMKGPVPEHVDDDPYQSDSRVTPAFNGSSPSGDVTAEVVYANYGRPEDFKKLTDMGIDVRGKIVLVRYGANFRGVKVYIAQQYGAAGVLIYSDPADDGYFRGDMYPHGPYRPATSVQRGAVQYLFKYPGDALTPGVASRPDLPASERLSPQNAPNLPKIPSEPLSYHDAAPILEHLTGPDVPHGWQGALPFTYHVGPGVKVHMVLKMDYKYRTIWDVIGRVKGTEFPDEWVIAGNHRDAWVYGAVDPNSGTAAMLEAVHGLGALLQQGWKPKRSILFCSWDAEEEGLIGSTEWAEDHAKELEHAVAYFNTDVGVAGPNFEAAAVPSLKEFIRNVTKEVPSPKGGTVYDAWKKSDENEEHHRSGNGSSTHSNNGAAAGAAGDVEVGDLGSGSDYTPFIQHLGVPSTDVGSSGPYGVYHSVFDDFAWFTLNADPTFVYEQEMARVFGLEVLHMADADVLPYDYVTYGKEIADYLDAAQKSAANNNVAGLDFSAAGAAVQQFIAAAGLVRQKQDHPGADMAAFNAKLRQVEGDFLSEQGLPNRPWYKHTIYAPGEYTGYAAVVIPGVNEAIDAKDSARAAAQLAVLTQAIQRATATLQAAAQ
ncbi:M28 family metallopeptidase [Acidipila sp. 4G-K13]|uniref:Glutamate carboxypeptidase n=2 Tax=Paracidobacterium acidisoli TaxID=2303751 RepID=A0A372IVB7_9BACT|nr:M28 family metallopeptidase [Paracidobacterium acidisoli]